MNIRYLIYGVLAVILVLLFYPVFLKKESLTNTSTSSPVTVIPVTHATAILKWDGFTLYTDPTGTSSLFASNSNPDLIFITDIHGDHLSTSTLARVGSNATLIVPQAVRDLLPENLSSHAVVIKNGETKVEKGFTITAIPMYNLPVTTNSRHTKGRGNGYVIERDGFRVYVAGDTSGIPEMRSLKDIDIAFIPMNLPYTMSVEEAADAVLAFAPKEVYPYHYRGQNGLSDITLFKKLVDDGKKNITVLLKDWYGR